MDPLYLVLAAACLFLIVALILYIRDPAGRRRTDPVVDADDGEDDLVDLVMDTPWRRVFQPAMDLAGRFAGWLERGGRR